MLIVMDKSLHEERLSQSLQTSNKQSKGAITFLIGYNVIFNVTISNINIYYAKSITDKDGFIQINIPQGAYELDSLNYVLEKNIIDEEHLTETDYPLPIKPNFSTLSSIMEISRQEPLNSSLPDDSIRDLLGFNASTIYEEYKLSPNPAEILSIDNIFLENDIAKGMIFKGKRWGIIHNFTMDFNPSYIFIEKFRV